MNKIVRPQVPIKDKDSDYIYPLTTIDQVVAEDERRLNAVLEDDFAKINYVDTTKDAIIEEVKTYTDAAVQKARPRNLLINSDFTNPVNQRNITVVSNNKEYFIDCWLRNLKNGTVEVIADGIKITNTGENGGIQQQVLIKDGAYTLACTVNNEKYMRIIFINNGVLSHGTRTNREDFQIYSTVSNGLLYFNMQALTGKTVTLSNAALYEGEYTLDTLPEYQPKGYEYELLMCRQYDPNTGEYIGLRKFGQPVNLLDNSDFTNPVNQRGQDSYNGNVYGIDRWKGDSNDAVVTLLGDGITVMGDHLNQIISNSLSYAGKVLSFALCDSVGNIEVINTLVPAEINSNKWLIQAGKQFNFGLWVEKNGNIYACFKNAESSNPIVWAALYEGEYTLETLPEYQPKGYGAELAECQRYFLRGESNAYTSWYGYAHNETALRVTIPTHVPIRKSSERPTLIPDDIGALRIMGTGGTIIPTAVGSVNWTANGITAELATTGLTAGAVYLVKVNTGFTISNEP